MRARAPLLAAAAVLLAGCSASEASNNRPGVGTTEPNGSLASAQDVTISPGGTTTSGPSSTTAPAHPTITDNRVYLVGDSITESIASRYSGKVCDVLGPLGWNVTVDAVQGRNTGQAVQSLRAHRSGVGQVMVVLIGHNDGLDPEAYRGEIEQLIALVPEARRIVVLTNYEFERGRDRMNEVLREVAASDGEGGPQDRIELVDWNADVEAVDGAIQRDGLHLTSIGQEALADTIATALGQAPPAPPGQSAKLVCTTLRSSSTGSTGSSGSGGSGGGSGGSGRPSTTTPQTSASTSPPATNPPATHPPDTVVTSEPPTTHKGKPPPSSGAPPVASDPPTT